jgi:hypothetical protein
MERLAWRSVIKSERSVREERCRKKASFLRLNTGIRVKRDKVPSIAYSEELIFSISATLQSTDRHHGIVGQEHCHF